MIHIACAADAGFVPHCAAMIHSVLSSHGGGEIQVHFLHDEKVPSSEIERLSALVQNNGGGWRSHEVGSERRAKCPHNRRFGQVAWYRVLLPELLPELSRVLYLDADTIVRRPLTPLWSTDLNGKALGAVVNPLYPFMDQTFLSELRLTADSYFNSGVLLFDLDQWRRDGLTNRVLERANGQGSQEWPDQNALNVVLRDRWVPLAPEWNAQNSLFDLPAEKLPFSSAVVDNARKNPAIIHYIGPYKPWHYRCKHSWRHLYWHHLAQTPWRHSGMRGKTVANRFLRLLPEQYGWRLEASLRKLRAARNV